MKFLIKCKFCGNKDQDKFQTTMEPDIGYSIYTILDSGYIEIKCLTCGTFMSTDSDKEKLGSNKKNMFEIICPKCFSINTEFTPEDCESIDNHSIICKDCKYIYNYKKKK